jgi:hypothetical protein
MLNLPYNAFVDGLVLRISSCARNDESFLDVSGAQRIHDPTTSGDFTRRFDQDSLLTLIEAINAAWQQVWEKKPEGFSLVSLTR